MRTARGFILLPVVLTLTLLAAVAYLVNRESGMNASLAARGFDADTARYVAEAGLARMNHRAQSANCTGYVAYGNEAFGAHRFSAAASPASGTPVTLQATGTTASGATTTLTRSNVTVRQTTPYVMTLQPGASGTDTYISSNQTTFNYGGATAIVLKSSGAVARILLRFDLSGIPPGAHVQSAQLDLYATNASAGPSDTLTAYRVTRAWTEGGLSGGAPANGATWATLDGTVAWTAAGGDYDGASGASSSFPGAIGWNSFNVAPLIAGWTAGTYPNHGMMLVASAGVTNGDFVSSDHATVSQRPKLTVTFLPPCGWTPPTTTVTLTPAADAHLNGTSPGTNYGTVTSMRIHESGQRRGLFQFNTTGIAAGTPLVSATLRLYVTSLSARSGGTMTLEARPLTAVWTESRASWVARTTGADWTSAGGDYGAVTATLDLPSSFNSGWIEFDIKSLAQAWVDGTLANNGAIIRELSPDEFFVSSKEAGGSTAPQLVITH